MIREGASEKDAKKSAFSELMPKYRKLLIGKFLNRMMWVVALKDDHVYTVLKSSVRRLVDEEDFELEEAWKYAIQKRKFLFDKLFKAYKLPEVDQ